LLAVVGLEDGELDVVHAARRGHPEGDAGHAGEGDPDPLHPPPGVDGFGDLVEISQERRGAEDEEDGQEEMLLRAHGFFSFPLLASMLMWGMPNSPSSPARRSR